MSGTNPAQAGSTIVMGVRFVLELASLAAYGLWGYSLAAQPLLQWGLALLAPLVIATIWGSFVAPKARRRVPDPARIVIEIGVFGGATAAFAATAAPWVAITFGVVALVDTALVRVLGLN